MTEETQTESESLILGVDAPDPPVPGVTPGKDTDGTDGAEGDATDGDGTDGAEGDGDGDGADGDQTDGDGTDGAH